MDQITRTQNRLIELGFRKEPADKINSATYRDEVRAFQRAKGLADDGIVGRLTLAALFPVLRINRSAFFAHLRSTKSQMFAQRLTAAQVVGMEGILDGFDAVGDGRQKTLAYGLATARREVGSAMTPVREGFQKTDAQARAYVARHYPNKSYSKPKPPHGFVYYGRGFVQLTHDYNYADAGILDMPDKALEPRFAAELLFEGLLDGRWNGQRKGIAFYLPTNGKDDLMNARRTVNITDHWQEIAGYYQQFMAAIDASKF